MKNNMEWFYFIGSICGIVALIAILLWVDAYINSHQSKVSCSNLLTTDDVLDKQKPKKDEILPAYMHIICCYIDENGMESCGYFESDNITKIDEFKRWCNEQKNITKVNYFYSPKYDKIGE